MNYGLKNIIQTTQSDSHSKTIHTILHYLTRSQTTSQLAKGSKQYKKQEAEDITAFCDTNEFWVKDVDSKNYISEGAEQKVYLKDDKHVYKLNDSIYYLTWEDYFNNLLLNNYFFTDTAYQLIGFYEKDSTLYAVVKQAFIKANQKTNVHQVKQFMEHNGFINQRNNDYYNPELGIILEDLHDENVLTQDGILYFIDTVFYTTPL